MSDLLLVGDVGGTNTRLRVVRTNDHHATAVAEAKYGNRLPVAEGLSDFLSKLDEPIVACCLGVAGRVIDNDVRMTNRPGESITNEAVAQALGLTPGRVRLVNDMVAHSSGVDLCETIQLRPGTAEGDVEGIVMPGTGLGIGFRVRTPAGWFPVPSEGGHLDFGPPSRELDVLRDAARVILDVGPQGRVSWENLCSGPALPILWAAVKNPSDPASVTLPTPKEVTADLSDDTNLRAATIFLELVGARAGNLLLGTLATRRMTFGGGILNELYDKQPDLVIKTLSTSFNACGPDALRETLAHVPLALLRSHDSGIIGAAALARELA